MIRFADSFNDDPKKYLAVTSIAVAGAYFLAKNIIWLRFLVPGHLGSMTPILTGIAGTVFTYMNLEAQTEEFGKLHLGTFLILQGIGCCFLWAATIPITTTIFFTTVGIAACLAVNALSDSAFANNFVVEMITKTFKAAFIGILGGVALESTIILVKAELSICQNLFNSATLLKVINLIPNPLGWQHVVIYSFIGTAIFMAGVHLEDQLPRNRKWISTPITLLAYGTYCYFAPLPVITNIAITSLGTCIGIGFSQPVQQQRVQQQRVQE